MTTAQPHHSETYTVAQIAGALQVTSRTIRNLITRGELAAIDVGQRERPVYRITAASFDTYLAAKAVAPKAGTS